MKTITVVVLLIVVLTALGEYVASTSDRGQRAANSAECSRLLSLSRNSADTLYVVVSVRECLTAAQR